MLPTFDGIDDKITWGNLGLDGTSQGSPSSSDSEPPGRVAPYLTMKGTPVLMVGSASGVDICNYVADFKILALPSSMWYRQSQRPMGNGIVSDLPTMEAP